MSDSFGHDVETAYLIDEGDTVRHGAPNSKTRMVAKMLVDHALQSGGTRSRAGCTTRGSPSARRTTETKSWWAQAENLNALLLMHEKYGAGGLRSTGTPSCRQWQFIRTKQIDAKTGGWFYDVGPDGKVFAGRTNEPLEGGYHTARAMLNVSDRLARLADESGQQPNRRRRSTNSPFPQMSCR